MIRLWNGRSVPRIGVGCWRDRIDLLLFRVNESPPAAADFVFDTLAELRARGWIGAFGWSTDHLAGARRFGFVESPPDAGHPVGAGGTEMA